MLDISYARSRDHMPMQMTVMLSVTAVGDDLAATVNLGEQARHFLDHPQQRHRIVEVQFQERAHMAARDH